MILDIIGGLIIAGLILLGVIKYFELWKSKNANSPQNRPTSEDRPNE